ncbi:MAG TPA: fibronectin type III domain-containing protein [Gemmatimonadales bacterium]|jgi:hypothetical protein
MKVTSRNMVRAALVFTAAGVIGAFGACKNDNGTNPPPPPPPPPPPAIRAPIGLTATAVSATKINLAWTDSTTNETGFRVDRCSGAACTNFAQVGTNLAANTVAFTDSGLTASTSYSYRVRAFNATDSSAWTSTVSATTLAAAASAITLIGAGEITTCSSIGTSQTAALIQSQVTADPNTIVFTAGNNVADSGAGNYSTCFDPTWGKFKSNMHAALGDMDFKSTNGTAPYEYFGAAIGSSKGYYSFDAGSWHIIVLNTTAEGAGKCAWSLDPISRQHCADGTAPELDWLQADLTANTKPCLMAISWERRLYTSGTGSLGRNSDLNAAAEMLYAAGLDVLVSAKDQQYERFPKLNVDGAADPKGFAQFIVGTGGRSLGAMHTPLTGNPVIAQYGNTGGPDKGYGVVQFTLHDGSYDAKFVPTTGNTFADSVSSVACN